MLVESLTALDDPASLLLDISSVLDGDLDRDFERVVDKGWREPRGRAPLRVPSHDPGRDPIALNDGDDLMDSGIIAEQG